MLKENQLEKVCHLAKLSLNEQDKANFLEKLNHVFDWIEQLSKIDVSGIDLNDIEQAKSTPEEKDIAKSTTTMEEVLSNTTNSKYDMFCVPKIVE